MISRHCSYRVAISHQSVAVGCLVTEAVDDWACQAAETVPSTYEATIWGDVHEAWARPHCPLQTNQEGAGSVVSGSRPNQLIAVCERDHIAHYQQSRKALCVTWVKSTDEEAIRSRLCSVGLDAKSTEGRHCSQTFDGCI